MGKYYLAVNENEQHPVCKRGWGNGYVLVPKSSILYGRHYMDRVVKKVADALVQIGDVFVLPENIEFDFPYLFNDIDVHYGITWSALAGELKYKEFEFIGDAPTQPLEGYWAFGFDTAHCDDCLENRPKEWVIEETLSFANQLLELERKLIKK